MNIREDLNQFNNIVIKLGSNVITNQNGETNDTKIEQIINDIATLTETGKAVIIVSSGAINAGRKYLTSKKDTIDVLQALSSVGQPKLINKYSHFLSKHNLECAQILVTHDDFKDRQRFLNVRNTINTLLKNNIIPILNENDSVSFTEITLGDNDHLAAMTAQMMNAQILMLVTSTNGLYDKSPQIKGANHIPIVEFEDDLKNINTNSKTSTGKGGMRSKIKAAQKVTPLGITAIICSKDNESPVLKPLTQMNEGTIFKAKKLISSERRKAWLLTTQKVNCTINIDEGAYNTLIQNSKSLLPGGIISIIGSFNRGDCISISYNKKEFAIGLTEYSSQEVDKIKGYKSSQIDQRLGFKLTDEVIHKDNLVLREIS